MQWTKPDFQEITLNMEVTGYVNTDDEVDTMGPAVNLPPTAKEVVRQPVHQRENQA